MNKMMHMGFSQKKISGGKAGLYINKTDLN